jgi:lipopolysaccharide/colanic/teichoic acid biosynthesis glycosyltransferase
VTCDHMDKTFYLRFGKRSFDLIAASSGLVLLLPVLVPVALAVKLSSRGPILFRQVRVGQFGRPFRILKFRSMRIAGEPGSQLTASGDRRITRVGGLLRRTKIDELPQLFNVVMGDMSLVGPRPEVPEFTSQYTKEQRVVLCARPGVTGSSVNIYEEELLAGRNDKEQFYIACVLPGKLEVDLEYCRNITFATDLHILHRTFAKLLLRVYELTKRGPQTRPTTFKVQTSKKSS